MSWMAKLYETYEQALNLDLPDEQQLIPLGHSKQNAHINIVINSDGNFLSAKVLFKNPIILPATEKSAGRTGKNPPPHPLADKIQYLAKDFYTKYGGKRIEFFDAYISQLRAWCSSHYAHPKAVAILKYIEKATLVSDLVEQKILFLDEGGALMEPLSSDEVVSDVDPVIFRSIQKHAETKRFDQSSALVCWSVYIEGDPVSDTWKDKTLHDSWAAFNSEADSFSGFCYVSGENTALASNHPSKIIKSEGNAKLISSNDWNGFTFLGRFTDTKQSAQADGLQGLGIGLLATQKSHNALRWLINRQGIENGKQVIVCWAVSGRDVPKPIYDINDFDLDDLSIVDIGQEEEFKKVDHAIDMGESFSKKLRKYIAGYKEKLSPSENISILIIDSATPGRVGVTYYRDFLASEYLAAIERWHSEFSWLQRLVKKIEEKGSRKNKVDNLWSPFAPSPYAILHTVYGDVIKSSEILKKNIYERLIPCIAEGVAFPWDLVSLAVKRASNRNVKRLGDQYSTPHSELIAWEKDLGVACALYRGYHNRHPIIQKRRDYSMSLETENRSRDYLYGRLLAIADAIEGCALRVADEKRPTNAARLMQRFADRPFSTWRTIKLGLSPYIQRLQNSKYAGFLFILEKELDCVSDLFETSDFTSDKGLSGEFLLGYHCQRQAFRNKPELESEQS